MGKLCSSEQQTPKVGGEKTGLQSFTNTENPLGTTLAKFWKAKESTQAVYIFAQSFCKGSILIHFASLCAAHLRQSERQYETSPRHLASVPQLGAWTLVSLMPQWSLTLPLLTIPSTSLTTTQAFIKCPIIGCSNNVVVYGTQHVQLTSDHQTRKFIGSTKHYPWVSILNFRWLCPAVLCWMMLLPLARTTALWWEGCSHENCNMHG